MRDKGKEIADIEKTKALHKNSELLYIPNSRTKMIYWLLPIRHKKLFHRKSYNNPLFFAYSNW